MRKRRAGEGDGQQEVIKETARRGEITEENKWER